jgi:hypothetical protein
MDPILWKVILAFVDFEVNCGEDMMMFFHGELQLWCGYHLLVMQ